MELVLIRKYDTSGTNGSIFIGNELICHSVELPWKTNQKRNSCVPEGKYELVKRYSAKFKWHLMLMNVPERAYILIHPANNAFLLSFTFLYSVVKLKLGSGLSVYPNTLTNSSLKNPS